MIYIVIAYKKGCREKHCLITATLHREIAQLAAEAESEDTGKAYGVAIYSVPDGHQPPGLIEYIPSSLGESGPVTEFPWEWEE